MEDSKPQINGVPEDIPDDILKNVDLFHDIDRIVKKRGRNRARGKRVKPPEKQGAFCVCYTCCLIIGGSLTASGG
jgi:hypothetical protein